VVTGRVANIVIYSTNVWKECMHGVTNSQSVIKTWQLTTSADQLRTYKIDSKYNIKRISLLNVKIMF